MALVERVNLVKRHTRPNPQKGIQGGILEKEAPVHVSNLMVIDPQSGKPTRVGRKRQADGSGVRVAKKSGTTLG
jgi:large subunit ribosomal protein L24